MKKGLHAFLFFLSFVIGLNAQTTVNFAFTGAPQTWTVPAGVTSINVVANGAQGVGNNGLSGGNGGTLSTTVAVTPGDVLNIYVGGTNGYNGGGIGGPSGGGATDIRLTNTALTDRILVAGGGGGSAINDGGGSGTGTGPGGLGGGTTGGTGGGDYGGLGGTQSAGGDSRGVNSFYTGMSGVLGVGGNAAAPNGNAGGGGGGGYYGGGGGGATTPRNQSAGGGGSSFANPTYCSRVINLQGMNLGNGSLSITYSACPTNPITITAAATCAGSLTAKIPPTPVVNAALQNSSAIVPYNAAYTLGTSFSIEGWSNGTGYIATDDATFYFGVSTVGSGTTQIFLAGVGGWFSANTNIVDGKWHHVAVTYDGANVKFYTDGVLDGTNAAAGSVAVGSNPIILGRRPNETGAYNGFFNEVRLWNTPRTAAEIQTNYDKSVSGTSTGLIGYWQANEGTGNVLVDASPTANNAAVDGPQNWVGNTTQGLNQVTYTYAWSGGATPTAQTNTFATSGNYSVTTTSNSGCTATESATATVTTPPTVYNITGGGAYCPGSTGASVGLDGSETTARYQLRLDGVNVGSPITGTGAVLDFGPQLAQGVYSVMATTLSNSVCSQQMNLFTGVKVLPEIVAQIVTGGGAYCSGTAPSVGLANSETGVAYQLQLNGADLGLPVSGSDAALDFGVQSVVGTYTVIATKEHSLMVADAGVCATATGCVLTVNTLCTRPMKNSVAVSTTQPTANISYADAPFCTDVKDGAVTLTGVGLNTGGTYSASSSDLSVHPNTGEVMPGLSVPGTYTVTYTLPASGGCAAVVATTMVTIKAVPVVAIAGVPSFCASATTPLSTTTMGDAFCWKKAGSEVWSPVGSVGFSAGDSEYQTLVFVGTTPYVAYQDKANGYKATVQKFDGTAWVNVGSAGFTADEAGYPSLAFSGTTPYVAFSDVANNNKTTVMKFDGTNWVNVGNAGFSADYSDYQSLAFNGTTPYVAFRDGGNGYKSTVMKFEGGAWVNVGNPGFSTGGVQEQSLAFDGTTPYVAYPDNGSNKIEVMKFESGAWVSVGGAGISTGNSYDPNLVFSGSTPYVAYVDDAQNNKITVSKFVGGAWVTVGNAGISAGDAYTPRLAFSGTTPYVAFTDEANGDELTVMKFDGTAWVNVGSAAFSAGEAYTPSIAFSGTTPYVAFTDEANGSKTTVLKFDLPCISTTNPYDVGTEGTYTLSVTKTGCTGTSAPIAVVEKTSSKTFAFTGAPQTYTVPAGITALTVVANGAAGAVGTSGGKGGRVTTTLKVTAGQVFNITVGGAAVSGTGGYNGGGTNPTDGYGGGGATDIRLNGTTLNNRIIVAGGGGGSSGTGEKGGNGGGLIGANGADYPGTGGSQTAGGTGIANGALGIGGDGGTYSGAGGGGYYGGGSGIEVNGVGNGGGGGGSSYTDGTKTINTVHEQGANSGDGSLQISIMPAIAYLGSPFCNDLTTGAVTLENNGAASGTYSSTGGLTINTSTGEINPSTSTAGTYTVTYTATDVCGTATTSTASVTITEKPIVTIDGTPSFCTGTTTPLSTTAVGDAFCWKKAGTETWQPVGGAVFSAGEIEYPSLVFSGTTPYIAYQDYENDYKATVQKFDGTAWVNVGNAGFSASDANYTSLAFSGTTPYVAFSDDANSSRATVMKFDGANWVNVGNAGFSLNDAYYTSLAFSGTTPYVAFQDGANGYKTTVMKFESGAWVNVGSPGFSTNSAEEQKLVFDGTTPYVAYTNNTTDKVVVMTYNGSSWVPVGTTDISTDDSSEPSLAFSGSTPYVAYIDDANDYKISVSKFVGGAWATVGNAGISAGDASGVSLAFNGTTPYIAYTDEENDYKLTVKKYDGTAWVTVGTVAFSGSEAYFPSLAFDGTTPYVAYSDDTDDDKATVVKFDLPCLSTTNNLTVGTEGSYSLTVNKAGCVVTSPAVFVTEKGFMRTFAYTGAPQTYTVPAGVTSLKVVLDGAAGANAEFGGKGGRVTTTLSVTAGQVFNLFVGGAAVNDVGGYNGGGSTDLNRREYGSGGGGATDMRLGGATLGDRVIVAGGGGGASVRSSRGGNGGGLIGADGADVPGGGGSQTAGGIGGFNGTSGIGGFGDGGPGGGGGGYFGGGSGKSMPGGREGGGGGGSSYTDAASTTNTIHEQGVNSGNGTIKIFTSPVIAYAASPYCNTLTGSFPITVNNNGYAAGTYSSTTGLTINATTGEITPSSSTVGAYTVTYTVTGTDGCGDVTTTTQVAIRSESKIPFAFSGGVQTYTVPANVTSLMVTANGGAGGVGTSPATPAKGGRVATTLKVTPGQVLNIYVGASGDNGGFNGGGGATLGWRGGGATDIRVGGSSLADRVIVAGAAGGTNDSGIFPGAAGGGLTGADDAGPYSARGGSQMAGGTGGSNGVGSSGGDGTFGIGGNGTTQISGGTASGGGGGGGYYGGGGNFYSAGGGGSSFADATQTTGTVHEQGVNDGNGSLIIMLPTPEIVYKGAPFCNDLTTGSPTLTGADAFASGTYSSTMGLTIDATTGIINPSTSTAGTYIVTYAVAMGVCGPITATTTVVITDKPTVNIIGTPYFCTGATTSLGTDVMGDAYCWKKAGSEAWNAVGGAGFSAGEANYQSLAFSGTTPYVAFQDDANGGKASVVKFDGTNWIPVGNAGFSAGAVNDVSLAFSGTTPYVAYSDDANGLRTTVMKYDGTSWVTVGNSAGFSINNTTGNSLVFNGTIPYVAYSDAGNFGKTTVMKYDGTAWVSVGNSAGISMGDANSQSLAFDGTTPYVAYSDRSDNEKTTVLQFDGTNWIPVGNTGFSAGEAYDQSLVINGGIPYVAYSDEGNGYKTTVMKYDAASSSWIPVGNVGFSGGEAYEQSLVFIGTTPYVAFQDEISNYGLAVMKFDGTAWVNVGNPGISAGEISYASLAVNGTTPYVAYRDGANGRKTTVVKFDLPCLSTTPNLAVGTEGSYTLTLSKSGCVVTSLPIAITEKYTMKTFAFTGAPQTYTVPAGVTALKVVLDGAAGATNRLGGKGGRVTTTLSVTAGQVFNLFVGGAAADNVGGYNGGGNSETGRGDIGAGGGATDMRLNGTTLNDRIIVAGGGGGSSDDGSRGGNGGGLVGANGGGRPGTGGSQTAGGTGDTNGASGIGGSGVDFGGGGGGGYFGGGSGAAGMGIKTGGGGGGSSYTDAAKTTNTIHEQGVNSGNGLVKILTVPVISYAASPYCNTLTGSFPITLIDNGYAVGTYSSTTGLTINATTGAITPSSSTVGAYTVTYTVTTDCGDVTTTTQVVIRSESKIPFGFSGVPQTYTVPAGVTSLMVTANGGAGGNSFNRTGGKGGLVTTTLKVTPGQVLNLYVGASGEKGGYNGGASFIGGGATDIRIGGTDLSNRVIVSGGGGGGGRSGDSANGDNGGAGGGLEGGSSSSGYAGGGTQTNGGGVSSKGGSSGVLGIGGVGNNYGGGGGGEIGRAHV